MRMKGDDSLSTFVKFPKKLAFLGPCPRSLTEPFAKTVNG